MKKYFINTFGYNPHIRFYNAIKRRILSNRIDKVTDQIIKNINVIEFNKIFKDDIDPFHKVSMKQPSGKGSLTTANLKNGIRTAVTRYFVYGFNKLPAHSKILDLGCGCGYFLVVCRHFGHLVTGLDLSIDEGYNKTIKLFKIDRIDHGISLDNPMPSTMGQYDLITAFLTTFNKRSNCGTWDGLEWCDFLDKVKIHLTNNGLFFVQFNKDHHLGKTYSSDTPIVISLRQDFNATFFADCMKLVKK